MTDKSTHIITCTECGKTFEKEVVNSLDITNNNILLSYVMCGDIFMEECPHCKKRFVYDRPVSCVDLNKKFMVQYANDEKSFEIIINTITQDGAIPEGLLFRVTIGCIGRFLEKVGLLSMGINDIVAEVYKEILFCKLNSNEIFNIAYNFDKDVTQADIEVLYTNKNKQIFKINEDIFNSLYQDVSDRGVLGRDNDYVVNEDFAVKILFNEDDIRPIHLDILEAINSKV